jgi:TM2 domain-containing membrane protein YozV
VASPRKLTLEGETHSVIIGFVSWLFGVFGAHRFYYGRKLTGVLWFFTLGLLGIGWIVDLFFIPSMNASACRRYVPGRIDYSLTWVLFAFLGIFGVHHFYMGQVVTGVVWLLTGGLCGLGLVYDLVTLNEQISDVNAA